MNPVGELLQLDDIALDLEVANASALLQRVAAMLARRGRLPEAEVLSSLKAREELGSTALGHGIAIPHARMADWSAGPLNWAAICPVMGNSPRVFGSGQPATPCDRMQRANRSRAWPDSPATSQAVSEANS